MSDENPEIGAPASGRIASGAAEVMRHEIGETGGREVFFAGRVSDVGLVVSVRVVARGGEAAVPAVLEALEPGEAVMHNHPSGGIEPSDADLDIASICGRHGHACYVVDNAVSRVYVMVEPFLKKNVRLLDPDELAETMGAKSALAKSLPHYEARPQQARMMATVARAFNGNGIAVVEAPTGVGKTLAYLLPAALWAVRNRERVVISTRTINLQEQIVHKDIPLLQKCLKEKFMAVLVKGRGNYVCLRRLERAISEASLFDDEAQKDTCDALVEWVKKTDSGSREDLPFYPSRELWELICSEADSCVGMRCPSVKKCFVTKARREVAKADLIVTNHHMFFSDVAIKKEAGDFSALGVFPAFKRVVFDEAHSIEDSATEYFGAQATRVGALSLIGRFVRREHGRERGLIPYILVKMTKEVQQVERTQFEAILDLADNELLPALAACREALTAAFDALRRVTSGKCAQMGRDVKWRLTPEVLRDPDLREAHATYVLPAVEEVSRCVQIGLRLHTLLKKIPPRYEDAESPLAVEIVQLAAYCERLTRLGNVLAEGTSEELEPNTVRWIEIDSRKPTVVRVARCPLEVGESLAEWVYERLPTVIMTSATLAVRRGFDYFFSRTGLDRIDQNRIESAILETPFNFERQAILGIPRDIPAPDEPGFLDECTSLVRDALDITRGHAFVLFTSFSALDHTFRKLEDELRKKGIAPLKQGTTARTQLLDRFRSDASSVLFATDSFWEGVDVAGEALQCVILPKLPFRVPTEPVLEARVEAIVAGGGNAFLSYTVPQAVIKFRQGFGRLIRRKTDWGAVLVLDRRILTKFYGRLFLESLPGIHVAAGTRDEVYAELKLFFAAWREQEKTNEP